MLGKVTAAVVLALCGMLVFNAVMSPSRQYTPQQPQKIEWDTGRLAEHLAALVTFPTVTREVGDVPASAVMDKLHGYLAEAFPRVHETLERRVMGESGSVVYVWRGSEPSKAPAMLAAHLDVVPADDVDDWTAAPFDGAWTQDGYVYGRGTMDNKVNVIGQLEAVEALLAQGFVPTRTLYLAYGADEEVCGTRGAAVIAAQLREELDAAGIDEMLFVADEGLAIAHDMVPGVPVAALVGVAEKGYVNVQLETKLTGGHASMPHPGDNAVAVLASAVVALDSQPFPARLNEVSRAMLMTLCPEMPFALRLVMCNLAYTDWLVQSILLGKPATAAQMRTTTSVNILRAGTKANVIAGEATAVLNHRIAIGESIESVVAYDRVLINDDRVKVTAIGAPADPSPVSSHESLAFSLLARSIRNVFPDAVVAPALLMASTDTKHYHGLSSNVFRFMPLRVTGTDLPRIHGIDERISVSDLGYVAAYYLELIVQTNKAP